MTSSWQDRVVKLEGALTPDQVVAILAESVAKLGLLTQQVGGRVAFAVDGGARWEVDLDTPGGHWTTGASGLPVEVTVEGTPGALSAIVLYPKAIRGLVESRELRVIGDRKRLRALSELIAGGGDVLGQRTKRRDG